MKSATDCERIRVWRSLAIAVFDQEELIDSRIGVHDKNQFEVKLDYSIDPSRRKNRYRIETYFFIPRSLGINSTTYPREQFYSDIQAYIRFKTPNLSLGAMTDPANEESPLIRIQNELPALRSNTGSAGLLDRLSREMRMVGCLIRANVRDRINDLKQSIDALEGKLEERALLVTDVANAVEALLAELGKALGAFRVIRLQVVRQDVPLWLQETFKYVDEYLSLSIETYLAMLVQAIDGDPALRNKLAAVRAHLREVLVNEREHRRSAAYTTSLNGGEPSELFIHQRGLLKKFVMSILFLEISKEAEGKRASELAAAGAAGVAMLFAAAAAIYAQEIYGLNSLPFVLALVVSYMVKDRIKEWLKRYFSSKVLTVLPDYDVKIRDPLSDLVIGRCQESCTFINQSELPPEVMSRRHLHASSPIEVESKREVVLKYAKTVAIRGGSIDAHHGRLADLNDIVRFNVSTFLQRMDDAEQPVLTYERDDDAVEKVPFPKVYHLNIVFVLKAVGRNVPESMERVRVVLDKNGIKRIEEA